MKPKNEKSVYRHRGYECVDCAFITMVFGNDIIPTLCPNCKSAKPLKQEWDHQVTSTVTVEDWSAI